MPYTAAKLVEDMEQTLHDAEEAGVPEDEIEDLGVAALTITHRIMASRREQIRTLEEEISEMRGRSSRFAKRLSEDRTSSAR